MTTKPPANLAERNYTVVNITQQNIHSADLEEIRRIIVKLDDRELNYLKSILSDKTLFAREIAQILPSSFIFSQENGGEINMALIPVIEQVLADSIATRPGIISDALAPIIGKTIRKAINAEFKKLIHNFNSLIENNFSVKGIKWRYQALLTGKSYGEIVILNTLGYKIENVLLIHKETGLLLKELHESEELLKDADLVSSMLRAIMDFVKDSMQTDAESSLETIEIGDNQVWIETGDKIILACVIKGFPPNDYREIMLEVLEIIQLKFKQQLINFNGNTEPFDLSLPYLEKCFHSTKNINEKPGKKKNSTFFKISAAVLLLLFLYLGIHSFIENYRWNNFKNNLQSSEGIYLTHADKKGKNYAIKGMRTFGSISPLSLAVESKIDSSRLNSNWQFIMPANNISLENYIKSQFYWPKTLELTIDQNKVMLSGLASYELLVNIEHLIESKLNGYILNKENLKSITAKDLEDLIDDIKSVQLFYKIQTDSLTEDSQRKLEHFIKITRDLNKYAQALQKEMIIEISGHSDTTGEETFNKEISLHRANKIGDIFTKNQFNETQLVLYGMGSTVTRNENISASEKRRVEIEILFKND